MRCNPHSNASLIRLCSRVATLPGQPGVPETRGEPGVTSYLVLPQRVGVPWHKALTLHPALLSPPSWQRACGALAGSAAGRGYGYRTAGYCLGGSPDRTTIMDEADIPDATTRLRSDVA